MFSQTNVSDPSFDLVRNADFVVFNEEIGSQVLGGSPSYEFVFNTRNDSIHEAPVYVPELDAIIFSLPHQGIYEQQIIHLNDSSPRIANYTTKPPVYAVNGGKYYDGSVYWAAEAGTTFPNPDQTGDVTQAPGIYRLDPVSGKVTTLLNNYFGTQFNSPNDLFVDQAGDIWFTDSWYGYAINVTASPVLPTATWRFRPSTGQVTVVDNSLSQPNGIDISPDGQILYITDTGVTDFSHPPAPEIIPRYSNNPLGGRSIYAFDINAGPSGSYLTNKRPIWLAEVFADDGFHVSSESYLLGAAGPSVDILSPHGDLLMKIQTNYTVNNVQFAGPDHSDLWLFGEGGISRVRWNMTGMPNE
ncbi:MAG: hypothetical protein Q9162_001818 [Coniocarpon cinnabarinum]